MKEIYIKIKNFTGYEVSNTGKVKSFKNKNIIILKPRINKRGYLYVNLCVNGKYKSVNIHKLVAKHFLCNYKEELTVNHIDENKKNNVVSNLEVVSKKDNILKYKNNHINFNRGENNGRANLKNTDIETIRRLYDRDNLSTLDISKIYKVSRFCIYSIVNKKTWKYI